MNTTFELIDTLRPKWLYVMLIVLSATGVVDIMVFFLYDFSLLHVHYAWVFLGLVIIDAVLIDWWMTYDVSCRIYEDKLLLHTPFRTKMLRIPLSAVRAVERGRTKPLGRHEKVWVYYTAGKKRALRKIGLVFRDTQSFMDCLKQQVPDILIW